MRISRYALTLISVSAAMLSCNVVDNVLHDDVVVATLGEHTLTQTELNAVIPGDLSAEDSTVLADRYIDSWAYENLFMDVAESKLSEAEKDVTKEIEDYKRTLLQFRYEQIYINERLDTVVAESEIEQYRDAHEDRFKLESQLVKARYIKIMSDSPAREFLISTLTSADDSVRCMADSLAAASAFKYTDWNCDWIDVSVLETEFGKDWKTLQKARKKELISIPDKETQTLSAAYVFDTAEAGSLTPLEICSEQIKDIIISNRKRILADTLERELLEDARSRTKKTNE